MGGGGGGGGGERGKNKDWLEPINNINLNIFPSPNIQDQLEEEKMGENIYNGIKATFKIGLQKCLK